MSSSASTPSPKITIHVYDYEGGKNAEKCGLPHNESRELTLEQIFSCTEKCNIMVIRHDGKLNLCLDSRRFQQR